MVGGWKKRRGQPHVTLVGAIAVVAYLVECNQQFPWSVPRLIYLIIPSGGTIKLPTTNVVASNPPHSTA